MCLLKVAHLDSFNNQYLSKLKHRIDYSNTGKLFNRNLHKCQELLRSGNLWLLLEPPGAMGCLVLQVVDPCCQNVDSLDKLIHQLLVCLLHLLPDKVGRIVLAKLFLMLMAVLYPKILVSAMLYQSTTFRLTSCGCSNVSWTRTSLRSWQYSGSVHWNQVMGFLLGLAGVGKR